jgi:hypothetical protein
MDIWRFIKAYCGGNLRDELKVNGKFYQAVYHTALKLYQKEFGKIPMADPFAGRK